MANINEREPPRRRHLPFERLSFPRVWALGLGIAAVSLLFTSVSLWMYAYTPGIMPLPPIVWITLVGGGGLVLLLFRENWQVIWATPLLYWVLVFIAWNVLGFLLADRVESATAELNSAVITVTVLVAIVLINAAPQVQGWLARLIVLATLLAVGLNVYDLFFPLTFSRSFGRSAGFYVNPNISGYAIGAGMLVGLRVIPAGWRPWFVMTCGAGIVLTLSRGSMLNWAVCSGFLVWRGILGVRHLVRAGALLIVIGLVGMTVGGRLQAIVDNFDLADRKTWERLSISQDAAETDVSVQTRKLVARRAWETFEEHPLLGAGLGATRNWDIYEDTHNLYLKHLAQFGVLGPLLFAAFAFAVSWGGRGSVRILGQAFTIFLLLEGLTSHNVLEDRAQLICAGSMAAVIARDRLRARPTG